MFSYTKILFHFVFAVFLCGCSIASASAQQTFVVDNTGDDVSLNACTAAANDCSLRGAINSANASAATADTITFDQSAALFGSGSTITLANGELGITDSVTISQTSAAAPVTIDAAGGSRIFNLAAGATVILTRLKLTNVNGSGNGGAILNGGTLTVNQSNITLNTANQGGGIYNNGGTVNINRSTLSENNAASGGGGIYNFSGTIGGTGTVTLTNSTVSGNSAGGGFGGGYNGFADLGTTQLNSNNATIASNVALNGGGIAVTSNTGQTSRATIDNTIIGDNAATNNGQDVFDNSLLIVPGVAAGTIMSSGYNIVENTNGASITPQPCNASAQICDQFGVDARLLPLADNNFIFAPTHALNTAAGSFSPAIDKGDSTLTSDQRGQFRPVDNQTATMATGGNNADIGSFELQNAPTAAIVTVGGRVVNSAGRPIARARVTMTDLNGETGYALTNAFGFYRFANVAAGETYVFKASAKRYEFAAQILTVNEDANDLNFTGAN